MLKRNWSRIDRRLTGPPGVLYWLATGLAILAVLDASSRPSVWVGLQAAFLIGLIGVCWALGALLTASGRRWRSTWKRWLAVPAAITLVCFVAFTDIPANVRLAVSRPAMDSAAREVMAGGNTDRSWIGLYPVRLVEGTADSVHFLIDGAGLLDGVGFAYFKGGKQPADSPSVEDYESIGLGWWRWSLYFD